MSLKILPGRADPLGATAGPGGQPQHHRLVRRYHSRGADAFCRAITPIDRWHRFCGLPAVQALQHTLRFEHTGLQIPASLTPADLQAALYHRQSAWPT